MQKKIPDPQVVKQCATNPEPLLEILRLEQHNTLCTLANIKDADDFRFHQGYLKALEATERLVILK